jgi:hypothetical protein
MCAERVDRPILCWQCKLLYICIADYGKTTQCTADSTCAMISMQLQLYPHLHILIADESMRRSQR